METVEAADEVWLPFIVLDELRAGFAVGTQGPRNEAILRRFLLKPGVDILDADEQTTHHSLVLQHSPTLYDRDAHFDALPQLTRV